MRKLHNPQGRSDELPGSRLLKGSPFQYLFPPVLLFFSTLLLPIALFSQSIEPFLPFPNYRQIETEHIRIIFLESDEAIAREIESFAEPAFREVSTYLGYMPPGKVPVLIDGRTDTPNGAFAPAPDRVIILPSPLSPFRLKTLFIHELVHYINLTSPSGIFGFLGRIFGDGVRGVNSALIPGWMAEGITVYLETLLTEEGRGRDEEFKAVLKGILYDKKPWEYWKSVYAVESYPQNRIYLAGYFLVRYLSEEYGAKSFMQLYRRWTGWAFFSQNLALGHITGEHMRAFYREMIDSWEKEWAEDFSLPEGQEISISFSGLATDAGSDSGSFYPVSVNKQELIFYHSGGARVPGIYSLKGAGKERPKLILKTLLSREESVDVDGSHQFIIFAARSFRERSAGSSIFGSPSLSDIYLYDRKNRVIRQLTEGGSYLDPAISDDGSLIIAVRVQDGKIELVELPSAGGKDPGVVASFPEKALIRHPRISPDMRWVTFTASPREGEVELYLLQREGGSLYRIPLPGSREARPEWRDERSILFSSDRSGSLAINLLTIKSSIETSTGSPTGGPTVSLTASLREVLTDPVGADRAIAVPDFSKTAPFGAVSSGSEAYQYIYRSYRSGGKYLFSASGLLQEGEEAETNLVLPPIRGSFLSGVNSPGDTAAEGDRGGTLLPSPAARTNPSRPYIPFPLPHTLLPFLSLDLNSGEGTPIFGATILAGEASETAELSLSGSFLPNHEQLEGWFRLSHRFFYGSLELGGRRNYSPAEESIEGGAAEAFSRSDLSLSLNHPIYSSLGPFKLQRISASLSGMLSSFRYAGKDFSLAEEADKLLYTEGSASFSISSFTSSYPLSSRAFFGGNDLGIGVSGTWAPAILDRKKGELVYLLSTSGGFLPLKESNIRIVLGGRVLHTTGEGTEAYIAYQNSPDWNVPPGAERNGRAFLSLSLQIPAPLFETRILWIPVTRFGVSLFAETGFTFQDLGLFEPDHLLVTGLKLDSRIMISRIPIPFTLISAFRIDPSRNFDPFKDIAISIRFGL